MEMSGPELSLNAGAVAEQPAIPVQRPLAEILVPGHVLTDGEVADLRDALGRLDTWAAEFRKRETSMMAHVETLRDRYERMLANYPVPIVGLAKQDGPQRGLHDDLWAGPSLCFTIRPRQPVRRVVVHGWVPENIPDGTTMTINAGPASIEGDVTPGLFSWSLELEDPATEPFLVEAVVSQWTMPEGPDGRKLTFVLREIELEH
jgi:hypothetical protein